MKKATTIGPLSRPEPDPTRRVLVVEDNDDLRLLVVRALRKSGFAAEETATGAEAIERATADPSLLLLLDHKLDDMTGRDVVFSLSGRGIVPFFIMMTGHGDERLAAEMMKYGAADYLVKGKDLFDRLPGAIEQAFRSLETRQRHREAQEALRDELYRLDEMVGASEPMRRVAGAIGRAAILSAGVLISGEGGTGKELVARAIHKQSPRADWPFVKLDCAAIPQELVESELLGYEKGAFPGAQAAKRGKLEAADKGTLFLDEIGDMPARGQAGLLRFLEEGETRRVGGTAAIRADTRVLAATSRSLEEDARDGRFCPELLSRLTRVTIAIPPLRERIADILLLAEHFLTRFCERDGLARRMLTEGAARLLIAQPWPGNVRELENTMHRIAVMVDEPVLTPDNIQPFLQPEEYVPDDDKSSDNLQAACARFEREHIRRLLLRTKWNTAVVARLLGIDHSSLLRKLTRLGIAPEATSNRSGC